MYEMFRALLLCVSAPCTTPAARGPRTRCSPGGLAASPAAACCSVSPCQRDGRRAPLSFHSNNWQCRTSRGPFSFFPCLVFFSPHLSIPDKKSGRQRQLSRQEGDLLWQMRGEGKKTFSQQQARARRHSLCRRSRWLECSAHGFRQVAVSWKI